MVADRSPLNRFVERFVLPLVTGGNLYVDGLTGPAITTVTGSGTTWTVSAGTGTGSGTLGLNLSATAGIIDSSGNALCQCSLAGFADLAVKNGNTILHFDADLGAMHLSALQSRSDIVCQLLIASFLG